MFGRGFELFKLFGFRIRVDLSWFIIAALVAWSLATGVFPEEYPGLEPRTYWTIGVIGALGLFASVILHELGHALMARRFGLEMRGITLFIFGGVAEMTDEPPSAKAEFWVAVAGPAVTVVLGLFFLAVQLFGTTAGWPTPAVAVAWQLGFFNVLLLAFNLLPAFPLDGGRVLRSALWQWKDDLRWATRVTSRIGAGFGLGFIFLGVLVFVASGAVGALWYSLIGLFLRGAAQMSYQQLLLRQILQGEPVRRFMQDAPVTVPRSISVRQLVDEYVYRHHFKMFPVVDDGRLVGCVTTRQIKELPREEWEGQSVGAVALRCDESNTVAPDDDAMKALAQMSGSGASRLMVVEGDRLVGILALKDLLQFFSLKVDLEGLGKRPA